MRAVPAMHSDKTRAGLLALVMHTVFIALIVFSVTWQKKPPPPVVADLWSELPPMSAPKVAPAPPPTSAPPEREAAPEPEPPPKPVPRVVTPPPPPKFVAVPLKPDIAIKQPEKEKPLPKPKPPAPRPDVEDAPKPKPKPVPPPPKPVDNTAQLERERERKALEAERATEARAAADAAATAEKAAAADRAAKAAAAHAAAANAARDNQRFIGGIRGKVYARVAVPPDVPDNAEAVFSVSLLPGGELQSVTLRRSSGNPAYDAAVERAIRQAQPFDVPSGEQFQRYFRTLSLAFLPR